MSIIFNNYNPKEYEHYRLLNVKTLTALKEVGAEPPEHHIWNITWHDRGYGLYNYCVAINSTADSHIMLDQIIKIRYQGLGDTPEDAILDLKKNIKYSNF